MPSSYLIAGQAAPAADTDTTLYTVPVGKNFVASSIVICNRNLTNVVSKFRIAIVPSGETLANEHYLFYDQFIDARETLSKLLGLSLAAGDFIVIRADSANLSFSLFGSEIS